MVTGRSFVGWPLCKQELMKRFLGIGKRRPEVHGLVPCRQHLIPEEYRDGKLSRHLNIIYSRCDRGLVFARMSCDAVQALLSLDKNDLESGIARIL